MSKVSDNTHLAAFQHTWMGGVEMFKRRRCASPWATLLVKSVGEKLRAVNT